MPLYYFNLHTRHFDSKDLVGEHCISHEEARQEALRTAREFVKTNLLEGREPPMGWIEVEDEEHRPLLMLPLIAAAC